MSLEKAHRLARLCDRIDSIQEEFDRNHPDRLDQMAEWGNLVSPVRVGDTLRLLTPLPEGMTALGKFESYPVDLKVESIEVQWGPPLTAYLLVSVGDEYPNRDITVLDLGRLREHFDFLPVVPPERMDQATRLHEEIAAIFMSDTPLMEKLHEAHQSVEEAIGDEAVELLFSPDVLPGSLIDGYIVKDGSYRCDGDWMAEFNFLDSTGEEYRFMLTQVDSYQPVRVVQDSEVLH